MKLNRRLLAQSWRSWISRDMVRVGPWWLQLVWTFVFSAVVAVGFTILGFFMYGSGTGAWRNVSGWAKWYGLNLVVALCIGFTIHALFELSARMLGGAPGLRRLGALARTALFAGVPLLGVAIGWPLGVTLAGANLRQWFASAELQNTIAGTLLVSLLLTFLLHQWFSIKARQVDAERRATEAQLRLLQGQIEPHFLFNTLANVLSLIEHDTPKARRMLEAFTDYLRASLTHLRRDDSPLGQELDLADGYLRLMQARMEERLVFHISADADARRIALPPLLLQPLVENAVQHGLEPKVEGGSVHVDARVEDGHLVLTVSDNGLGLGRSKRRGGAGVALANTRERLLSRYGTGATLEITEQQPGTRARLVLPLEHA